MKNKRNNKNGKNRIIKFIIIGVIVVIVFALVVVKLSGGNKDNDLKESKKVVKEKKSQVKIIDLDSNTRPYAIMINCKSEALPQVGLQDAYMVYEEKVEGGITRMVAFFKDKDLSKVGSVRSARVQFLPFVFENDAIYVHAGGAKEATNRMINENIDHIDADGKYGERDSSLRKVRAYEHTLFTNTDLLKKAVNDFGYRDTTNQKPILNYQAEEVDLSDYDTQEANNISIVYSSYRTSNYTYDPNAKTYLRSMNNIKNIDLETGEQYKVKNILIYGVQYNTIFLRGTGYSDPKIYGTGEGYYVTNGVALPIIWEKVDEKSQTIYRIKETGKELKVNDGNTYVQIYPLNGGSLTIN